MKPKTDHPTGMNSLSRSPQRSDLVQGTCLKRMEEADGPAVVEDVEEPAVVEVIFCTGGGDVWCCMVVAITLTCTTVTVWYCGGVYVCWRQVFSISASKTWKHY